MNELVNITSQLQQCDKKEVSKQVMGICRAITPQFYKNLTTEDMRAEKLSIELLTADIDNETLSEMCRRAVLNYSKERSLNSKTYFDINYILQFYRDAFNYIHCEKVDVSRNAEKIWQEYDCVKGILYQKWQEPNGEQKVIGVIQDKDKGHKYSPKDYQKMYTNIEDIDI
jgi:hypothetical protein